MSEFEILSILIAIISLVSKILIEWIKDRNAKKITARLENCGCFW